MQRQSLIITANGILAAVLLVWTQGWWGTLVIYGQAKPATTTFTAEFMLILIYLTILTCLASIAIAWMRFETYAIYAKRLFFIALCATIFEILATLFSYLLRAFYGSQLRPSLESIIPYESIRYPIFGILAAFALCYLVLLLIVIFKPKAWQRIWNSLCKLAAFALCLVLLFIVIFKPKTWQRIWNSLCKITSVSQRNK